MVTGRGLKVLYKSSPVCFSLSFKVFLVLFRTAAAMFFSFAKSSTTDSLTNLSIAWACTIFQGTANNLEPARLPITTSNSLWQESHVSPSWSMHFCQDAWGNTKLPCG